MTLFTYGSLTFPEVLHAVTGLVLRPAPAVLPGYARTLVRNETYPGIVPDPSASTDGALYHGLDAAALARLDRFEGEYYHRTPVTVHTSLGAEVAAETYVFHSAFRHLLTDRPWDRDTFRSRHLARFLSSYQGFTWASSADPDPR